MIDPRLQALRLVRQLGTVTAAAHTLHRSPSAVSQQLHALERDLGVDLLRPRGRRVELTAAAELVLAHADVLWAQWERARADLDAHRRGDRGPVRLCGFPGAIVALLGPTLGELRERRPDLDVQVVQAEAEESLDLLVSGEADLAVLEASPQTPATADARFHQEPLLEDRLQLVVPAGHLLADRRRVALLEVADEPWIGGPTDSSYQQIVREACGRAGFTPGFAHRALDWRGYLALVGMGLGVALVPRLGVARSDRIVSLGLTDEPVPSRRILSCVRRGSEQQGVVRELRLALDAAAGVRAGGDRQQ